MVVLALVQDLIPKPLKEAIVFLRLQNRLPGHRCFNAEYDNPSRFDRKKIKHIKTLSNADPPQQQVAFYSLYKKVAKKPAVEHYSIRYLAWRDVAAVSLVLAIVTLPVLGLSSDSWRPALEVTAIMILVSTAAALAGRHAANELVYQVLALSTTG